MRCRDVAPNFYPAVIRSLRFVVDCSPSLDQAAGLFPASSGQRGPCAAAPVRNAAEIEEIIAKLGRELGGGLIVAADTFTVVHHQLLIRLAQQHRVPAVYAYRTYV